MTKFVEIESTPAGYVVWQRKPVERELITTPELHLAQWVAHQLNTFQNHVNKLEARISDLEAENARLQADRDRLREALTAVAPGPEQNDYLKAHGLDTDAIGVRAAMEVALHALDATPADENGGA